MGTGHFQKVHVELGRILIETSYYIASSLACFFCRHYGRILGSLSVEGPRLDGYTEMGPVCHVISRCLILLFYYLAHHVLL